MLPVAWHNYYSIYLHGKKEAYFFRFFFPVSIGEADYQPVTSFLGNPVHLIHHLQAKRSRYVFQNKPQQMSCLFFSAFCSRFFPFLYIGSFSWNSFYMTAFRQHFQRLFQGYCTDPKLFT